MIKQSLSRFSHAGHYVFLPTIRRNDKMEPEDAQLAHVDNLTSKGVLAIMSLQHRFPGLRRRLTLSWDAIQGWIGLEPPSVRRPLPLSLLQTMFCLGSWKACLMYKRVLLLMLLTGFPYVL